MFFTTMAESKGTIAFFLGALLLCSLLVTTTETSAHYISYADLLIDEEHKQNMSYGAPPANAYARGCEKVERCRD